VDPAKDVGDQEDDPFLRAIGERLRQARIDAGLTGDQLSERAGCSITWLYGLEAGHQNFTIHSFKRFVEALGLELRVVLVSNKDVRTRVATDRLTEITTQTHGKLAAMMQIAAEIQSLNAESLEVLHSTNGAMEIS
jgi:transcriptional regulator with XRE-family HTH domain